MTLQEFLTYGQVRNAWLREPGISVYVRRTMRWFDQNTFLYTLDIASIEVDDHKRGQGVFTEFLERAEATELTIYIENVMDLRFQEFFRKRGYTIARPGDESVGVLSFYKKGDRDEPVQHVDATQPVIPPGAGRDRS